MESNIFSCEVKAFKYRFGKITNYSVLICNYLTGVWTQGTKRTLVSYVQTIRQ